MVTCIHTAIELNMIACFSNHGTRSVGGRNGEVLSGCVLEDINFAARWPRAVAHPAIGLAKRPERRPNAAPVLFAKDAELELSLDDHDSSVVGVEVFAAVEAG